MRILSNVYIEKELSRDSYAEYLTKTEISKTGIELFHFPLIRPDFLDLATKHSVAIATLVLELNKIKIVEDLFIETYAISVHTYEHLAIDSRIDWFVKKAIENSAAIQQLNDRTKMEIAVYPNREMRGYKVDAEISRSIGNFHRALRPCEQNALVVCGPKAASIVQDILKIDGVVMVMLQHYQVDVEIASSLFSWNDVEPKVIEAIAKVTGKLRFVRK